MGYTNIRATMEWWYPRTKQFKYCSSAKFDNHNNKFDKSWYPDSNLSEGKENSSLTTTKIDSSDHPFIKDDIYEAKVIFPPRGTPIGIINYYFDNCNTTYVT